jgi:hypothetical protein
VFFLLMRPLLLRLLLLLLRLLPLLLQGVVQHLHSSSAGEHSLSHQAGRAGVRSRMELCQATVQTPNGVVNGLGHEAQACSGRHPAAALGRTGPPQVLVVLVEGRGRG